VVDVVEEAGVVVITCSTVAVVEEEVDLVIVAVEWAEVVVEDLKEEMIVIRPLINSTITVLEEEIGIGIHEIIIAPELAVLRRTILPWMKLMEIVQRHVDHMDHLPPLPRRVPLSFEEVHHKTRFWRKEKKQPHPLNVSARKQAKWIGHPETRVLNRGKYHQCHHQERRGFPARCVLTRTIGNFDSLVPVQVLLHEIRPEMNVADLVVEAINSITNLR